MPVNEELSPYTIKQNATIREAMAAVDAGAAGVS